MACRYADDAIEQSGEAGPEAPQRRSQGADLAALLDDSLGDARSFRYRCAVLAGQLLPAKAMTSCLQNHGVTSCNASANACYRCFRLAPYLGLPKVLLQVPMHVQGAH